MQELVDLTNAGEGLSLEELVDRRALRSAFAELAPPTSGGAGGRGARTLPLAALRSELAKAPPSKLRAALEDYAERTTRRGDGLERVLAR